MKKILHGEEVSFFAMQDLAVNQFAIN